MFGFSPRRCALIGRLGVQARTILIGLVAASVWVTGAQAAPDVSDSPGIRIIPGLEEPLVATGLTQSGENAALDRAVAQFVRPLADGKDFAAQAKPLETFLSAHPGSEWRTAVFTNLGLGYYHAGYFTRAATAWESAWRAGRDATAPQARALADRALGELARMYARVGYADKLEALFAEAGDRPVSGPATELVTGAHEGLWMFRNDWGTAYLCGPMALKNLLIALGGDAKAIDGLNEVRSGPKGFTFAQVSQLAADAKLEHRVVYRQPGQAVPVPSIINWKVNHFAAIVGDAGGRYHIKDPTFGGGDLWVSKDAIDTEASGYFLVPTTEASSMPWRTASASESASVYGMGNTTVSQTGATTPGDAGLRYDPGSPPMSTATAATEGQSCGMCTVDAKTMTVSLNLTDSPVGYRPPKGPPAFIRLTYNQREAYQPAVFSFFNVSPKWTLNVLSYIQDAPTSPGSSVTRYVAGGGAIDYAFGYSYSGGTGAFSPERQGQAVLVRIPATGPVTSYELRMPDGSKQVFARQDGATGFPRRIFLTQIVDAHGNALTLSYDAQLRLTTLTDATGRNTTFSYGAANPLLVTRITDPFGRSAALTYDAAGRLASITDVLGLVSAFGYDAAGLVNAMTTPYGTHRFSYGTGANNSRFLEMTDPLGLTERVEFLHLAPGLTYGDPVFPAGWNNDYLYYRNTFYWDKHVYPITHTDYTKARITHWLHNIASQTSPIVESTKMPLERRVWLRYPGQSGTYFDGTSDRPTGIARILDDGTTQLSAYTYNSLGRPLSAVDPVGRKTVFTYAANQVDLITVQQQTSASGNLSPIAAFTYNGQHLPLTYTDAAGQVTTYAYNGAGQLIAITNALNQTTSYSYDGFGRLSAVVNANGAPQRSFTYDEFDRVATTTDSEGYVLAYGYDALDRVTEIRYPDGTTTQNSYDRLDLAAVKDRLGRVTRYSHDANRRLIAVTDPLNRTTGYGYYGNGALASLTDPKGSTTNWGIDIQSRPVSKRFADSSGENYVYEATTSRQKSKTDGMGQVKSYIYARDDRVMAVSYVSTTRPTPTVSFTYDAFFPRRTSMTDGIGLTTWQYKAPGTLGALKLATEDGPYSNDTISYDYDSVGRIATRTVDVAREIFSYDRLGRTVFHGSALGQFAKTYLGQTTQLTSQSNGVAGTSLAYDTNLNDRRLIEIKHSGQARSYSFAATPENRTTRIVESIGGVMQRIWSYDYDASDRLLKAELSSGPRYSYTYDAADNMTSSNGVDAVYNSLNQISKVGPATYIYDLNGNLIDDGVRSYSWDAENRLTNIGYRLQPGQRSSFIYDGIGRRIVIADLGVLGTSETRFLWCGDKICQGRASDDSVTRRFFSEGFYIPQGGQSLLYAFDQNGSVRDIVAAQNGVKVSSYDYDPYGNLAASTGRVASEMRFAGMFYHSQSNLYLAKNRIYNPRSAAWLSRDTVADSGVNNLYGYVSGNPVDWIDPLGLARKLDPNGQECMDQAQKIDNIQRDIYKRQQDVLNNPENLPYDPPYVGAPPRASVSGHIKLIEELQEILKRRQENFDDQCGGGGGASSAPAVPVPQAPAPSLGPVATGLAVCGALVFCALEPEVCLFLGQTALKTVKP